MSRGSSSTLRNAIESAGLPRTPDLHVTELLDRDQPSMDTTPHERTLKWLKHCSRMGDYATVERVVRERYAMDIPVDLNIIKILMDAYAHAGESQRAEQYVLHIEERGITVDETVYNSVINAYAVEGNYERAVAWVNRMISQGLHPDEKTSGALCKALGAAGDPDGVEDIMVTVERSGGRLNEYHFASLISSCNNVSPPQLERAELALQELVRRGLDPGRVRRVFSRVVGMQRASDIYASIRRSSSQRS